MTCTRCQGLMLEEQMLDMEAAYGEMWSISSRCVNCGHRHDAVIQQHRQAYLRPVAISQTVAVSVAFDLPSDTELEPLAA
ncbi:MAG: hypothetical protein U0223_07580 [Nitrospira sp.]|nr:hypothetical protein [Nitrospira sp.]